MICYITALVIFLLFFKCFSYGAMDAKDEMIDCCFGSKTALLTLVLLTADKFGLLFLDCAEWG